MKKIFITHFFTKNNKGDAAILFSMIDQIKKNIENVSISVATTEPISGTEPYKVVHSFFYHAIYSTENPIVKVLKSVWIISASMVWAFFYRYLRIKLDFLLRKEIIGLLEEYNSSDMVVPVGGGYITGSNSLRGNMTIVLHLHAIVIALLLKKPVILFSQSIGPFANDFQRYITRFVLNKVTYIFARENYSVETLNSIGVNKSKVVKTVDAAFLFESNLKSEMNIEMQSFGITFDKPIVGITLKKWLGKDEQDKYERELAQFCNYAIDEKKMDVVIIPQVTSLMHNDDDRLVGDRIKEIVGKKEGLFVLNKEYSAYEIKGIYENINYLVGTRMHSCILSLISGIPVIAIQYEYKTGGMMKDLGLHDWVVKFEDVTFDLLKNKFDQLLNEKEKYLLALSSTIPAYQKEAQKAFLVLKEQM